MTTNTWLRISVLVGTLSLAFVACGGSDKGGGSDNGGEGGEGDSSGNGGRAGSSGGNSGGNGARSGDGGNGANVGDSGAGGEAGVPVSHTAPRSGTSIVSAGTLSRSSNFQAVLTFGEVPGGNTSMSSSGYRANLGFVGSVQ